jgi:hypothetical protein
VWAPVGNAHASGNRRGEELPVRLELPQGTQIRKRTGRDVVRRESALLLKQVKGMPVVSAEVAWLTEIERTADRIPHWS